MIRTRIVAAVASAAIALAAGIGVGAAIADEDEPERPREVCRIVGDDETAHKQCRELEP